MFQLNTNFYLYSVADKPFMQPRKDYDDYTKFINDTYTDEKINMLNRTVTIEAKRNTFTKGLNPAETLRTYSEYPSAPVSDRLMGKHGRSLSMKP